MLLNAQTGQGSLRNDVLKEVAPQKELKPAKTPPKNPEKKTTFVYMEHTDFISVDEALMPGVQLFNGNVCFRHDNALMYCDSAYFYQNENSFDAFGNVRIIQADTIFVYGDVLYYNGNAKLARLRHNVRMENKRAVLTTDSLNYDRVLNLAYYYTGGKIKDELNTLTSVWGQYSPDTERALFRRDVHLVNPNFTMDADTLKYNTKTNIADIVGSTHILYQDETDIYSERGWYNTSNERSMLLDRSLIVHRDGKTLTGDTIFYDKQASVGEAFSRVELTDSVQKTTLTGNYLYYNELNEFGLATDSALLVDWSGEDHMHLHADSLRVFKDSVFNVSVGHYNVRVFRSDMQAICDSLVYSTRDSVINLFGEPVLWAESSQLSGEMVKAHTKNQKVEQVVINNSAIASQRADIDYFNQLSGKEIIAYVDSGALRRIFVNGNAETIYFPVDEADGLFVGMNKTQSSYVTMFLKNKKVEKILLTTVSNGNMYPLSQASGAGLYLRNFFWLEEQRPKDEKDVFTKFAKTERRKPDAASPQRGGEAILPE
ncbi:MAG: hypothetical protein LBS07_00400 [Prevotellaceae bacterium]|nr:hypothetical protein [Prevotellaceae bacterium]